MRCKQPVSVVLYVFSHLKEKQFSTYIGYFVRFFILSHNYFFQLQVFQV